MAQKKPVEQGTSRLTREQKAARKKERHHRMMIRTITTLVIFFILAGAVILVGTNILRKRRARAAKNAEREAQIAVEEAALAARREKIREADKLALSYDYDGAIALLQSLENYDRDSDLVNAIAGYTATKSTLEAKDVTKIPHIFYHSLIVDPGRAFDTTMWDPDTLAGVNAWMTTVDEFDKITQQMYDRGWVLVRMRDLVTQKTDENGNVTFEQNKSLLLPQDKQPFVLSIDDWSYYHSYDGKGYADKAVVDENGQIKCQYTDASGNVSVGDYDVVPRLNTFLEAHPDGAYKGARGLIAMTGYNGVFGYRTDVAYLTGERLQADQRAFLESHPDFNWEKRCRRRDKSRGSGQSERVGIRLPYLGPSERDRKTRRDARDGSGQMAEHGRQYHRSDGYDHFRARSGYRHLARLRRGDERCLRLL